MRLYAGFMIVLATAIAITFHLRQSVHPYQSLSAYDLRNLRGGDPQTGCWPNANCSVGDQKPCSNATCTEVGALCSIGHMQAGYPEECNAGIYNENCGMGTQQDVSVWCSSNYHCFCKNEGGALKCSDEREVLPRNCFTIHTDPLVCHIFACP